MTWHIPKLLAIALLALAAMVGCRSRQAFYDHADQDAHFLLHEKSSGTPWELPFDFSAETNPASRHYRPDSLVQPTLPAPVTPLYSYDIGAILMNRRVEPESAPDQDLPQFESKQEELRGAAITPEAWKAIPETCLKRMLDFQTIVDEVEYTMEKYGESIEIEKDSNVRRLTLQDIVDIAIVNSRDFQAQKETLYLSALALAQERFQFQYRFSPNGANSGIDYSHARSEGTTTGGLSIPSGLGTQKRLLLTGGDLFARFANNVILTFNGTDGFVADVGSSVVFELVQPLIQSDIRFESLTQAERNLVYAARDFGRFRKTFFVQFANQYYSLIASFRRIEIQSQNYFSLAREFKRAEAEYKTGSVPRFQLDQVEQDLLEGRGNLINVCVSVESDLDDLKLDLGIPVETPLNIDLTELNELTRLDQTSVSADSINRILLRLKTSLQRPDRIELASTAAVMLERVIEAASAKSRSNEDKKISGYRINRLAFLIDYARLTADEIYQKLQSEVNSELPSNELIFLRSQSYCESLLNLVSQQINYAREKLRGQKQTEIDVFEKQREEKLEIIDQLGKELQEIVQKRGLAELPKLVESSKQLRGQIETLVQELDRFNEMVVESVVEKDLQRMVVQIRRLIAEIEPTILTQLAGLTPVDIDQDEAMITALVLRFDMMNQRGTLADSWRQIKLAADNLRSVMDLNARQQFNSDPTNNQPFEFSFDDSRTTLNLAVDTPANRFAQRNTFRGNLIRYQRALRDMNFLEDNIKRAIRNDLRNLDLDQQQYLIAVASAALAYERVVSTSIEFRLGTANVNARDFLESQDAYTRSLIAVAELHIRYIRNRTQLFLDLELLTVDEAGFWQDLRNESVKPEPYFDIPPWAQPIFGELPGVNYSNEMQQLLYISPDFDLGLDTLDQIMIDEAPADDLENSSADAFSYESIPNETIPNETIPNETIPNETIPKVAISNESISSDDIPSDAIPSDDIPSDDIPSDPISIDLGLRNLRMFDQTEDKIRSVPRQAKSISNRRRSKEKR